MAICKAQIYVNLTLLAQVIWTWCCIEHYSTDLVQIKKMQFRVIQTELSVDKKKVFSWSLTVTKSVKCLLTKTVFYLQHIGITLFLQKGSHWIGFHVHILVVAYLH